jgi:hypothetical protein
MRPEGHPDPDGSRAAQRRHRARHGGGSGTRPARPARDFVSDAYAHCKFIAYASGAAPLLQSAGLRSDAPPDGGFTSLDDEKAADFIARCSQLRFWDRLGASAEVTAGPGSQCQRRFEPRPAGHLGRYAHRQQSRAG